MPGIVVAGPSGRRPAGLGNEVIAWGKAISVAIALRYRPMHPSWILYPHGTPPARAGGVRRVASAVAERMPGAFTITEREYLESGVQDFGEAVRRILRERELSPPFIRTSGMWGGYASIRRALPSLRQQLLFTPKGVRLMQGMDVRRPRIAMHVRRGDFRTDAIQPGSFNRAIPASWFMKISEGLRMCYGNLLDIDVVTDADGFDVHELRRASGAVLQSEGEDARDALVRLATADLLICSISSFSLLAAFLSDRPYVWYAPHLVHEDGNFGSLWGHERGGVSTASTSRSLAEASASGRRLLGRSIAVGRDGDLTPVKPHLDYLLALKRPELDLIHYGVTQRCAN